MPATYQLRPTSDEYRGFNPAYVDHVPDGDIIFHLTTQLDETLRLLTPLTEEQASQPYAPGKWSIKQVVGHLIDTERVFVYRALCISRGDATPLPGFDQDDYVDAANFDDRPLPDLLDEWQAVRAASVPFFRRLTPGMMERLGTVNNFTVSVRAFAYLVAGHELHHRHILAERYLPSL